MVDPATEVRVKEMYWLGPARRANVIVLNRGPLPAPAWTYDGTRTGNWTFVDFLPDQGDLRKLGVRSGIVNAALTTTITKFLPEVLDTLRVMRSDAGIKLKPIIWHGSPYQYRLRRDRCDHGADEMLTTHIEEYLTATGIEHEPWVLYYNTQGTIFFPNSRWMRFMKRVPSIHARIDLAVNSTSLGRCFPTARR
jgi:hypothetical protein